MKTITLQGKQYAQVKDRIAKIHKDYKNVSINTEVQWIWDKWWVQVKATITIKDEWERTFTAHSFGMYKSNKDFEKLETIAVWRALAFAWFLADGEVASYEEMEDFIWDKAKANDKSI